MLNRVDLMGRLVADPELKTTPSGLSVVSLRLAVDHDFKDKQTGERGCDFFNVIAWRQLAEMIAKYFSKGRLMIVSGRLQARPYTDRNGAKRVAVEIVAENVYFGDRKPGGTQTSAPAPAPAADGTQWTEQTDDDEDLPF